MLKKLQKRDEGFTIIEVLIVLAIAGLILAVVLIAVPNLQRNQRNAARKDEVSRILTAASNYVANNNGTTLTNGDTTAGAAIISDAGTLQQYKGIAASNAGVITASSLVIVSGAQAVPATPVDGIVLDSGAVCSTTTVGATTTTGSNTRSLVIQYALEKAGGSFTTACIGS